MNIIFIDTDKYPISQIGEIYQMLSKTFENLVIIPAEMNEEQFRTYLAAANEADWEH